MNANTEYAPRPARALARGLRAAIQGLQALSLADARRYCTFSILYAPRHAAPAYAPRHAAPPLIQRIKDRACAAWKRLEPVLAWINCQMEKDMSGPALALSGALMGLIIWPVLLYCFFA
jgi:hypothetical protein